MESTRSPRKKARPSSTDAASVPEQQGRKRTARACDECRARKTRCNGLYPCRSCEEFARDCTYSPNTRRRTDPSERLRYLQHRLGLVREKIREAQGVNRSLQVDELQRLLDILNENSLLDEASVGADDESALTSMMSSFGRDTSNNLRDARFYGPPSGLAFLQRTEEFLTKSGCGPDTGSQKLQSAIPQLFDPPSTQRDWDNEDLPSEPFLPTRDTTLKLLTVVLTVVYPLFPTCDEPALRAIIDQIYSGTSLFDEKPSQTSMALLHIVLGLGYLFSKGEHQSFGCDDALKAARRHYSSAYKLTDFTDCRDFAALQLLLSFTVFQISVGRLASAHALVALTCSSALRLGLHHRSTHHADISHEDRATRRTIFWTVIKLDIYLSAVLGLPPFTDLRQVDPALDLTLAEAITEAEASLPDREAVHLAISAKHLELMRLISRAIKVLYPMPTSNNCNNDACGHTSVRLVELTQIEQEFKTWQSSASQILRKGDDGSVQFTRLKSDLEMMFYFSQIVLLRPFLHSLADSSLGGQQQTSRALICVKIASHALAEYEGINSQGLLSSASWISLYTLFLSIICLVFLIATQDGTRRPIEAWRKAEMGVRLLAAASCPGMSSTQCLEVLKQLVGQLSHTVDLDVAGIEAKTRRNCVRPDLPDTEISNPRHETWPCVATGPEMQPSSQSQLFRLWGITGSQLHLHGQEPSTNTNFDEIILNLDNPTSNDHDQSFGNPYLDVALPPPVQGAPDDILDVPTAQLFAWPSNELTASRWRGDIWPSFTS